MVARQPSQAYEEFVMRLTNGSSWSTGKNVSTLPGFAPVEQGQAPRGNHEPEPGNSGPAGFAKGRFVRAEPPPVTADRSPWSADEDRRVLVYGSYGYTGDLIVRRAIMRGIQPVVAGRRGSKSNPQADDLGLEARAFDLSDPAAVARRLDGVDARSPTIF